MKQACLRKNYPLTSGGRLLWLCVSSISQVRLYCPRIPHQFTRCVYSDTEYFFTLTQDVSLMVCLHGTEMPPCSSGQDSDWIVLFPWLCVHGHGCFSKTSRVSPLPGNLRSSLASQHCHSVSPVSLFAMIWDSPMSRGVSALRWKISQILLVRLCLQFLLTYCVVTYIKKRKKYPY